MALLTSFGSSAMAAAVFIPRGSVLRLESRPATTRLARSGRDAKTWLRALRDVDEKGASFRVAAVPAEELWRVVTDPSAAATARAGAAVALQSRLDDEARDRLRAVSATTVLPELRVALRIVADDADENTMEKAFEPLVNEPDRKRIAAPIPAR